MKMEPSDAGLAPLERGILADLQQAMVMTTGQIWRLRFAGTGLANCRLRLERLARRDLVRRLPRERGVEACWCLTPGGRAALGPAAGRVHPRLLDALPDDRQLRALLRQSDAYVQGKLAERAQGLALLLPPVPETAPRPFPSGPGAARGGDRTS